MARRGVPNEDLSNIEFETSEEVEVVPTFNSMVSIHPIKIMLTAFFVHSYFINFHLMFYLFYIDPINRAYEMNF